jgi:hypothetical protein
MLYAYKPHSMQAKRYASTSSAITHPMHFEGVLASVNLYKPAFAGTEEVGMDE